MEKRVSAELLGTEQNNSKNASSDSLNSDSKSSSLNSKMGQESVRSRVYLIKSTDGTGIATYMATLGSREKASHSKSFSSSSTSTDNNIVSALEAKKDNQVKVSL